MPAVDRLNNQVSAVNIGCGGNVGIAVGVGVFSVAVPSLRCEVDPIT